MISSSFYDGIPERTFDDWLNARNQLAVRTAALAEGTHRHRRERRRGKGKPGRKRMAVLCVETGRRFDSISEAASAVDCWPNALYEAMKGGSLCGGYHWQRIGGSPVPFNERQLRKPVELVYGDWVCGVWPSMQAAAIANGIDRRRIEHSTAVGRATKDGRRWCKVEKKGNA